MAPQYLGSVHCNSNIITGSNDKTFIMSSVRSSSSQSSTNKEASKSKKNVKWIIDNAFFAIGSLKIKDFNISKNELCRFKSDF